MTSTWTPHTTPGLPKGAGTMAQQWHSCVNTDDMPCVHVAVWCRHSVGDAYRTVVYSSLKADGYNPMYVLTATEQ